MGDAYSREEFSIEESIDNSLTQKCKCTMDITSCEWCQETESKLIDTITNVIDCKDNNNPIQGDLNIQSTIKKIVIQVDQTF